MGHIQSTPAQLETSAGVEKGVRRSVLSCRLDGSPGGRSPAEGMRGFPVEHPRSPPQPRPLPSADVLDHQGVNNPETVLLLLTRVGWNKEAAVLLPLVRCPWSCFPGLAIAVLLPSQGCGGEGSRAATTIPWQCSNQIHWAGCTQFLFSVPAGSHPIFSKFTHTFAVCIILQGCRIQLLEMQNSALFSTPRGEAAWPNHCRRSL